MDVDHWLEEVLQLSSWYAKFGDRLPQALANELDALEAALRASK